MSLWQDTALVGNHPHPPDYHVHDHKQKKKLVCQHQSASNCTVEAPAFLALTCSQVDGSAGILSAWHVIGTMRWRSWNSASSKLHVLIDSEFTHVHSMDWIEVTDCWIHQWLFTNKQRRVTAHVFITIPSNQATNYMVRTCSKHVKNRCSKKDWPILSRSTMHIHLSKESEIPR